MIAAAALLAWAWLLTLHGRFWQSGPALPPMLPREAPDGAPDVAIVVPARDEAALIARSLGSLLAQDYPGRYRVILVDDNSHDATAGIAHTLPGADRLTVIHGRPRPAGAGWRGRAGRRGQGRHARRLSQEVAASVFL